MYPQVRRRFQAVAEEVTVTETASRAHIRSPRCQELARVA
jgi:hypothetical protein